MARRKRRPLRKAKTKKQALAIGYSKAGATGKKNLSKRQQATVQAEVKTYKAGKKSPRGPAKAPKRKKRRARRR